MAMTGDSDVDYQSTSFDSDELLSAVQVRALEQNTPGTPGFRWQKQEDVPKSFGFTCCPGVNVRDLDGDSKPSVVFSRFAMDKLQEIFVQKPNQ